MEDDEWLANAKWVLRDWRGGEFPGPILTGTNRWMVQIPRLWRIYSMKHKGKKVSFQAMLENIFKPMVEATLYPEEHPEVSELLKNVVGFDSVDDEGNAEGPPCCTTPNEWTTSENPSYAWQLYYLWANITVINRLRASRGLNTFAFRPHSGETGDVNHLAATYMLCESINHGINLDKQVSLQYLYYLDQVGMSLSPLSNNFLFRKMKDNPFPKFFRRGMNVALSTDDPLLFHMSDDPLLEEYSVARASFDLSMTDLCEIARNSILQSGFEVSNKKEWLGEHYKKGVKHCDVNKTHVPLIRAKFRAEHLALEHMLMKLLAAGKGSDVLKQMQDQFEIARDGHRKILLDNFIDVPDGETVWHKGQGGGTPGSDDRRKSLSHTEKGGGDK
jgi:AMP deaminase